MPVRVDWKPKGIDWARLAIASARGNGLAGSIEIARKRWGEASLPHRILRQGGPSFTLNERAVVPAGASATGWAALLVDRESAETEFFSLVREKSLLGRVEGLRRVPLRTRLVGATSGFSADWVKEGEGKPVSRAAFAESLLPARKVVSLAVLTDELVDAVDPAAEIMIRDDMVGAMVAAIDSAFADPSNAGIPDTMPASPAYGAPTVALGGAGDMAAIGEAIAAMIASFGGDVGRAVFVARPEFLAWYGLNSTGAEQVGARGGSIAGVPCVPSKAVPLDAVGKQQLILMDPDGVAVGDAEMDLRVSRHGSIEMVDDPAGNSVMVTPTQTVSLFQTNSTAIKTEKFVNFERAREGAVSVLTALPGEPAP